MEDKQDKYLANIPIIKDGLDYYIEDNIVFVRLANKHRIQRSLRKIGFKIPKDTIIDFDTYSSFVFLQIDGKKDIYQIGQNVKNHFGEDAEPLYERLVTFIDFLEDNRRWVMFKNKMN